MSEKKNIDRLFQEKFKDFEAVPQEKLWQNIQAELQKDKKKRRVIPIWFRLSGVAAVLVIGMVFLYPFFNSIDNSQDPVVYDKQDTNKDGSVKITPTSKPVRHNEVVTDATIETDNTAVAAEDNATDENVSAKPASKGAVNSAVKRNTVLPENDAVADGTSDKVNSKRNAIVNKHQQFTSPQTTVATATKTTADRNGKNTSADKPVSGQDDGIVYTKRNASEAANDSDNNTISGNNTEPNESTNKSAAKNAEEAIAANEADDSKGTSPEIIKPEVKINDETAIVEIEVDSAASAVPENELEKLLQDKLNGKDDEETEVALTKEKWNIKPQLAPVFFNSLSSGSPIDAQFAGNSKEYNNDLSYGVGINYALSERISLRSGINSVNLSYATQGIEYYASLTDQTSNVKTSARAANIVVQNESAPTNTAFVADQLPTQTFNGSLVQQMGYVEVPVELSYAVVNKKFGIDIIGGVSTLFLNNNNVSVVSEQGYATNIGEAENLNNINFTTNLGIGFKYRFWKTFQANFEPTFKYQVNTFSRDAGNFKPYFIGLYSGISFSF